VIKKINQEIKLIIKDKLMDELTSRGLEKKEEFD
jgi:hypothetical protein